MRRALLLVALLAAVSRLPSVERQVRRDARAGDAVAFAGDVPVLPGTPAGTPELIARARAVIPAGAPVRIVVRDKACQRFPVREGFGLTYWLQYQLLPHPASCDPDEEWQVYALSSAPEGAEVVAPGLAIWHAPR